MVSKKSAPVLYDVDDGLACITLNRPERGNAWTSEMAEHYFSALDRASHDSAVRAILITGAGKCFCVGVDMEILEGTAEQPPDRGQSPWKQTHPIHIPKPIIAAVNGPCAGIGLVQALMSDVRIAQEGVKFTTSFVRRGLIAEHGIAWILPKVVGHANALDLLLSGRVIQSPEAKEMGLVNMVVPAEDLVTIASNYARELAVWSSPWAMSKIKAQIYFDGIDDPDAALAHANEIMYEALERPDFKEGVRSFIENRRPYFDPIK